MKTLKKMTRGHKKGKFFRNVASLCLECDIVRFLFTTMDLTFYKRCDEDGKLIVHEKLRELGFYPTIWGGMCDDSPIVLNIFHGIKKYPRGAQVYPSRYAVSMTLLRDKLIHALSNFFYEKKSQVISESYTKFFTNKEVLYVEIYRMVDCRKNANLEMIYHIHHRAEKKILRKMKKMEVYVESFLQRKKEHVFKYIVK